MKGFIPAAHAAQMIFIDDAGFNQIPSVYLATLRCLIKEVYA
jgi:hypothetical protein